MENKNNVTVNASTKEILKMLKKSGLVVQVKESKVEDVKSEFDNKAYHNTDLLLKQYANKNYCVAGLNIGPAIFVGGNDYE